MSSNLHFLNTPGRKEQAPKHHEPSVSLAQLHLIRPAGWENVKAGGANNASTVGILYSLSVPSASDTHAVV